MHIKPHSTFKTFLYTVFLILGAHQLRAQSDTSLTGLYSYKNGIIKIDTDQKAAIVVREGGTHFLEKDTFFQVEEHTGLGSWRASVYGNNLSYRVAGSLMRGGRFLIVYPKPRQDTSYILELLSSNPADKIPELKLVTATSKNNAVRIAHKTRVDNTSPARTYSRRSSGAGCSTVQCSGTTQKGYRCRRMTTSCSGHCYQH